MDGMHKSFGGVQALRGASLTVRGATVHGLVGENGAGKSTLLKILDGQYPHGSFSGAITLDGQPLQLGSPEDARSVGVAIVPQETHVIDSMSVGENICLGGHPSWHVSTREFERRAAEFLEQRGIPLDPREHISRLSASQRQLVMIARALFAEPRLLILDEPTSALTREEATRLFDLIRHLRDGGLTSIFVSHRIDEVVEICDRVTVMRDGVDVAEIRREEMTPSVIIRHMIGRELEDLFPDRTGDGDGDDSGEVALELQGVSVRSPSRRSVLAVDDVSLRLRRGEILGIGGLVGSGRSELLRAVYGALPLHRGRVELGGVPLTIRSPRQAIERGIGFLTEDRKMEGLLFNLGVRENLTLSNISAFGAFSMKNRLERESVIEQLRRFEVVAPSEGAPIGTLSGGNQQKVLLARSLQRRPSVLLLDEPTVGVDIGAKSEIYRLIRHLADDGVAVIVVSSESSELLGLCDRIIVLRAGKVVDRFERSEASEERLMSASMVGAVADGS
jgi:ABC-type sugar transport system ATPase subunit